LKVETNGAWSLTNTIKTQVSHATSLFNLNQTYLKLKIIGSII